MRQVWFALRAAAAALVLAALMFVLVMLIVVPLAKAEEPACAPEFRFETVAAAARADLAGGRIARLAVLEGEDQVGGFLDMLGETFGKPAPFTGDRLIAVIVPDDPAPVLAAFVFRDGCQVGRAIVRLPGAARPMHALPPGVRPTTGI